MTDGWMTDGWMTDGWSTEGRWTKAWVGRGILATQASTARTNARVQRPKPQKRKYPLAKSTLPDPLSRRHLLERPLDAGKAREIAEAYLAAGREIEAIEFLTRGEAKDKLAELQQSAVERGDVFLLRAASGALGDEPSGDRWRSLAQAAAAKGRERDAESALRHAAAEG
jgi:hypothetical protein